MLYWLLWSCTTSKQIDTSTNPAETTACMNEDTPLSVFEIFPGLPTTQIHADIAFDGEWIWTVFNLPNDTGAFDVYLGAVDCQGIVTIEPKQILNIPGLNQTTPRIAISQNHILVASQGDNGNSPNNLSIHLYVQDRNGNLVDQREWIPVIEGEETGNRWLPSVVGTDDGFWLAAAVANTTHFRTAVQRLNANGADEAPSFWVGPDEYAVFPNIDGTDSEFVVGWETNNDSIMWTTGTASGQDTETIEQTNASTVKVLWDEDGSPNIFASKKAPLTVQWNDAAISQLASTHYPNAAQGENSILMGHYRIQSGYSNDVYLAAIQNDAVLFQDHLLQNTPAAAPYRPAITNLGEDAYFLLWSQGTNPDFVLTGQFIDLATW